MSRVLETFLDLVRIDSPTGRESGVADYVRSVLEGIGLTVRTDDTRELTGADTGNLIVSVPGTTAGPVIAFSAHMDCSRAKAWSPWSRVERSEPLARRCWAGTTRWASRR